MELYDENEGQVIQENHDLQIQLLEQAELLNKQKSKINLLESLIRINKN